MQSCTHDWLASCAGNRYRPLAGVQNFAVWPFLDLSAENCHRYDRGGSGSGCRACRHKVRDERLGLGLHRSAAATPRLARSRTTFARGATTFEERLGLGGGDPDLAMLRVEAQDAVRGSSSTSKVGLAYAKADAQYLKAFAPTAASNLVGVSSLGTDFIHVKRYDDWRDRWPTKVKGTL